MFRNVHNPSGSTPQARNPVARRRTVFIALVLALVIGGAGQPVLAQGDGPRGSRLDILMFARRVKQQTICVGDKVVFAVDVPRRFESAEWLGPIVVNLPGVEVQSSVMDSGIGDINPPSNSTQVEDSAYFTFSAKRPGTTRIQFWGKVNSLVFLGLEISSDTVTTEAQVTVEECVYKIKAISLFQAQGVSLRATMEGPLKSDGDGRFTGEGNVTWVGGDFLSGNCDGKLDVANSQAELLAEQYDDELTVNVAYLPAALTLPFTCVGEDGSTLSEDLAAQITPTSVTFTVPASGGPKWELHNISHPIYSMQGDVAIYVTRVIN